MKVSKDEESILSKVRHDMVFIIEGAECFSIRTGRFQELIHMFVTRAKDTQEISLETRK